MSMRAAAATTNTWGPRALPLSSGTAMKVTADRDIIIALETTVGNPRPRRVWNPIAAQEPSLP